MRLFNYVYIESVYIMRPQNLLSVYQGAEALENLEIPVDQKMKPLKQHEIRNLHSFCDEILNAGCHLPDLDGFFVGYTIHQIGKEFDGRDHTTVLHACKKIAELREEDPNVQEDWTNLIRTLSV